MKSLAKLSSFLLYYSNPKIYRLNRDKLDRTINIGNYFWSLFLAHLPPALEVLSNLMQDAPFYFKLKLSIGTSKKPRKKGIS